MQRKTCCSSLSHGADPLPSEPASLPARRSDRSVWPCQRHTQTRVSARACVFSISVCVTCVYEYVCECARMHTCVYNETPRLLCHQLRDDASLVALLGVPSKTCLCTVCTCMYGCVCVSVCLFLFLCWFMTANVFG